MAYQHLPKNQPNVGIEPVNEGCNSPSPTQERYGQDDRNFEYDHDSPVSAVGTRNTKHVAHGSTSTDATAVTSETSSQRPGGKPKSSHARTWKFEMMAIFAALRAFASIVGVVFKYNGRALPGWPHDITRNALIALMATCANATMSVCLSSGISQAKWIRFKQKPTPLSDIEVFDEASRGSWGFCRLLVTGREGYVDLLQTLAPYD